MAAERRTGDRWARSILGALVLVALAYGGAYVGARVSHRLVRQHPGIIARPNAFGGWGFTAWELAFAPATWLEEHARELVDPTW